LRSLFLLIANEDEVSQGVKMEQTITKAITGKFFKKFNECTSVDVAIVGAGPSGLLAARELAMKGKKVALFERKLAPGGGVWGGGMLFNEIVVQDDCIFILEELGVRYEKASQGLYTADSVEVASALILGACRAGVNIFNAISVEDIIFREGCVAGLVINWTPVQHLGMHVDPLMIMANAVLDSTGHPSEISKFASDKAGVKLNTPDGKIMGERPMWAEEGEKSTVNSTGMVYPGLYASGMAANNIAGGFRMGPIFGGMLLSGKKVAGQILEQLG
jgi:sulfide-dependent adenosine diphosphate thiazole synthase